MAAQSTKLALFATMTLGSVACSAEVRPADARGETEQAQPAPERKSSVTNISITAGNSHWRATLADNATARDFVSMLPLTLTLEDYAATEKISDLPRRLVVDGAAATRPVAGDITYYAPWGNLAIFHRDGQHSPGLVKLGHFESSVAELARKGTLRVRIDVVR
jgi:hypothetical protein